MIYADDLNPNDVPESPTDEVLFIPLACKSKNCEVSGVEVRNLGGNQYEIKPRGDLFEPRTGIGRELSATIIAEGGIASEQTRSQALTKLRQWVEGSSDSIADRPHPITIRLAILSPVLSLAAIFLSLYSIYLTKYGMEVGRQADFQIQDNRFEYRLERIPNSSNLELTFDHKYSVQNNGGGPGAISVDKTFFSEDPGFNYVLPESISLANKPYNLGPEVFFLIDRTNLSVGAKSQNGRKDQIKHVLSPAAVKELQALCVSQSLKWRLVRRVLHYSDPYASHAIKDWDTRVDEKALCAALTEALSVHQKDNPASR